MTDRHPILRFIRAAFSRPRSWIGRGCTAVVVYLVCTQLLDITLRPWLFAFWVVFFGVLVEIAAYTRRPKPWEDWQLDIRIEDLFREEHHDRW